MKDKDPSGRFEAALGELEAIVKKLESEDVGLDESVELFRRGKGLAATCEELLKRAQVAIEAAAADSNSAKAREPSAHAGGPSEDEVPF